MWIDSSGPMANISQRMWKALENSVLGSVLKYLNLPLVNKQLFYSLCLKLRGDGDSCWVISGVAVLLVPTKQRT